MSTIICRKVNDAGPYAYRVTYRTEEGKHEWEYLGPVGSIDPEELTEDELEELRSTSIAAFRDLPEAQFSNLDVANGTRDELIERFGEDVLWVRDDRRETTIQLAEDAPLAAVRMATGRAQDDRQAARGPGQEYLTDSERDAIDFSQGNASVPHAMTAKSVIRNAGIDDWLAVYDPQVEDPAAFEEIAEANRESIQGDRLDDQDDVELETSMSLEEAESRMEREAIEAAREGFEEAREVLKAEYGYTEEELEEVTA